MDYLKIGTAVLSQYAVGVFQFFVSLRAFFQVCFCKHIFVMRSGRFSKIEGRTVVSVAAGLGFGLTFGLWGHSVSEAVWATQGAQPVPRAGLLFASLEDEAFEGHIPDYDSGYEDRPAPISLFDRGGVMSAVHTDRSSTSYLESGAERFVIRGEITPSLAAHVEALPASRLRFVELDSVGGDVSAAISIARRIRSVGGHTYIGPRGKCFSSCGVVFQGGVRRTAAPDSLFLLHYARQQSADPMFSLKGSVWGTVALIETMIDLGADPALYDQIPGMGDWLLTAGQAERIGMVQYVEALR